MQPTQCYPEPTVGALIFDPAGRLFLMKSRKWGGPHAVLGGHVELGETLAAALRRDHTQPHQLLRIDLGVIRHVHVGVPARQLVEHLRQPPLLGRPLFSAPDPAHIVVLLVWRASALGVQQAAVYERRGHEDRQWMPRPLEPVCLGASITASDRRQSPAPARGPAPRRSCRSCATGCCPGDQPAGCAPRPCWGCRAPA